MANTTIYPYGTNGQLPSSIGIINDLTTGGADKALSAEMGKVIRQNIMKIFNALGTYAFPEGKPVLNWGSTVINYNINVDGVAGLTITNIEVNGVAVQSMPQKIEDGKSLSFTLTKGTSQIYRGVSISMGGTNITESTGVWDESTGMVTITNVTGDIVVVASALTLVEYLQSDGNQWIDTGIVAGAGFKSEIKADAPKANANWQRLLGASDANMRFAIAVGIKPTDSGGGMYTQFGKSGANLNTIADVNAAFTGLHTFVTQLTSSKLSISVDGTATTSNLGALVLSSLPSLSLYLFSNHREDATVQSMAAKVYYCKIWNGSDLVFDAIPVRVGQVGYMYDRVSDMLLPNIGTGSFTLGNDITE